MWQGQRALNCRDPPPLCAQNKMQPSSLQHRACSHVYLVCIHSITYSTSLSFFCFFLYYFFIFFKSMKANFKASSKQNHLIHYRSEYRPLQNPLWDISVPTMPTMKNSWGNIVTSLRNIEPKLVVKLQPFGTERGIFPLINTSDTLSKLLNFRKLVLSYWNKVH